MLILFEELKMILCILEQALFSHQAGSLIILQCAHHCQLHLEWNRVKLMIFQDLSVLKFFASNICAMSDQPKIPDVLLRISVSFNHLHRFWLSG